MEFGIPPYKVPPLRRWQSSLGVFKGPETGVIVRAHLSGVHSIWRDLCRGSPRLKSCRCALYGAREYLQTADGRTLVAEDWCLLSGRCYYTGGAGLLYQEQPRLPSPGNRLRGHSGVLWAFCRAWTLLWTWVCYNTFQGSLAYHLGEITPKKKDEFGECVLSWWLREFAISLSLNAASFSVR